MRFDFLFGLGMVSHGVDQFAGRLKLRCLHLVHLGDGLIDRLHGVMVLNSQQAGVRPRLLSQSAQWS